MQILKAANQWQTRPAEERFWDVAEALQAAREIKAAAAESEVDPGTLRVEAIDGDLSIIGQRKIPAQLSHHAFGQLCARMKAPASYLRALPPTLAAQNLNHGLKHASGEDAKKCKLLIHRKDDGFLTRAVTSDSYVRIWNADLFERLQEVTPQGWRVPPARPASIKGERTRTATAADVSRMSQVFGAGIPVRVGDTIAPAGMYLSDKDIFAFLINENDPISDGTPYPLFRGIMLWNSEVGDCSLGGMAFMLKGVCGNHIVWDARNVMEFALRHVGAVAERAHGALEVHMKKYAADSANEEQGRVKLAKAKVLGATKQDVIDAVLGFARSKKIAGITQNTLNAAYDTAVEHEAWYGDPNTVYGVVNGLTEVSQRETHADQRNALDRAAGRVMTMAF